MRTQDASSVPLHLKRRVTWQRAVSLPRMSDQGKGTLGEALGAAASQDQVVAEGELGHDCHLDAVLHVHGRSGRSLYFCCVFLLDFTLTALTLRRHGSCYSSGKLPLRTRSIGGTQREKAHPWHCRFWNFRIAKGVLPWPGFSLGKQSRATPGCTTAVLIPAPIWL